MLLFIPYLVGPFPHRRVCLPMFASLSIMLLNTSGSTFDYVRDAEEAMYGLDRTRLFGRELDIQFAEGDRKSELLLLKFPPPKKKEKTCIHAK